MFLFIMKLGWVAGNKAHGESCESCFFERIFCRELRGLV